MEISLQDLKELLASKASDLHPSPFRIGTAYLIRTVTMTWVGRVSKIIGQFLEMEDASWVADTGRYSEALSGPISNLSNAEIERCPRAVMLATTAIVDAVEYPFKLPESTK